MRLEKLRQLNWLREVWNWLIEAKVVIIGLLALFAALLLGMHVLQSEVSIRIAGFILQLMGMVIAVRGLLAVRAHFGQLPLRILFIQWVKRFPKWRRQIIKGVGQAISSEAAMSVRPNVWTPDNPELPFEKRFEAVIKNVERIREEQSQQLIDVQELKESHVELNKFFRGHTDKVEKNLRADIESLHTGDILISLVGLVWLTVGMFLSTLAPELNKWLYVV